MGYQVGFIGGGAMAEAILAGLVETNIVPSHKIIVSDPHGERLDYLHDKYRVAIVQDNGRLIENADFIIIAVKPQVAPEVLNKYGSMIREDQPVLSIMAGITIATIKKYLHPQVPVIRVMPNTPCLVKAGVSAYCFDEWCTPVVQRFAEQLLSSVGELVNIDEGQMDAVTGVSGSGPAYIYLVMEAMVDAGVYAGLTRQTAKKLVYNTVQGAAQMALQTGKHTAELKDQVTSPGGTTIVGIRKLEQGKLRSVLFDGVLASMERAQELGGEK